MTLLARQKGKNGDEVVESIFSPTNTVGDDGTEYLFFFLSNWIPPLFSPNFLSEDFGIR